MPWQQARALALREASEEIHGAPWLPWIAERLEKVGGGKPSKQAVGQLFALVDTDKEWYPGKHSGAKRGRKQLLTPAKRRCIAHSAMAAKRGHGEEPCVAAVVHACPLAMM